MVFIFNSFEGLNDYDLMKFVRNANGVQLRNNNNMLIHNDIPRTELRMHSFTFRAMRLWNSLPGHIKEVELSEHGDNSTFKNKLKEYYLDLLVNKFDVDIECTWITGCRCRTCRPE